MNVEKKKEHWENIYKKLKHLDNYCKIELRGIEDATIYYHPTFHIDENVYISSQADIGANTSYGIYALRLHIEDFSIDIYEELLSPIILGYHNNKDAVILAMTTLGKVKKHIAELNNYTTEYVNNIIIGNSVKEITLAFINELSATEKIISFMQQNNSKL